MTRRRWQPLPVLVFIVGLVLTGVFALRTMHGLSRLTLDDEEPIRPWMNVPYIAHAYDVPPDILMRALNLDPGRQDTRPLLGIARAQNRPVGLIIAELEQAIIAVRSPLAPTAPLPPLPPLPPSPASLPSPLPGDKP